MLGVEDDMDADFSEGNRKAMEIMGRTAVQAKRCAENLASDAPAHEVRYADRIWKEKVEGKTSVLGRLHDKQEQMAQADKKSFARKQEQSL